MRNYKYKILNFLFLVVLFRMFDNTPLYVLDKVLTILSIFIALFFISYKFLFQKNYFYITTRRILACFLLLYVLSTSANSLLFDQPFFSSISANLATLQLFILIFYAYLFKYNKVSIPYIEKCISYFTILNIIVLLIFSRYEVHSVSQFSNQELNFKAAFLPKTFIRLSVFYFFVSYLKRKNFFYGLVSIFLLLFPNILLDFQRGYFTTAVALMLLIIFFIKKSNRLIINIFSGICVLCLVMIIAVNFSFSFINEIETKYASAISGIVEGKSDEASVSVRFVEINAGMKLFNLSPVVGSGRLRSENVNQIIGMDYYPSDVGVIGILSTYGIIGIVVFTYLLILILFKTIYILKRSSKYSIFTISTITYLLSIYIESIQTANVMLNPAYWAFIYLLYAYSKRLDDEANEELATIPEEATENNLPIIKKDYQ